MQLTLFLLHSGRFHLSMSGWQLTMLLVYLNGCLIRMLKRMKTDIGMDLSSVADNTGKVLEQ